MQISAVGLHLIQALEGLRETPSPDITGRMAIGYGHTYRVTADTPAISRERAAQLLEQDIGASFGPAIDELALPLTQNEFDATCSLVYQVGLPVLATTSPFGAALRSGNSRDAGDAMLGYNRVDGREIPELTSRRTLERALFLASPSSDPVADARPAAVAPAADERSDANAHGEPVDNGHYPAATEADLDALVLQRRTVWLAAVKGLRPDGTAVEPGWGLEGRAALYAALSRATDFQTRP